MTSFDGCLACNFEYVRTLLYAVGSAPGEWVQVAPQHDPSGDIYPCKQCGALWMTTEQTSAGTKGNP